jgi:hypothetical protein
LLSHWSGTVLHPPVHAPEKAFQVQPAPVQVVFSLAHVVELHEPVPAFHAQWSVVSLSQLSETPVHPPEHTPPLYEQPAPVQVVATALHVDELHDPLDPPLHTHLSV